MHSLVWPIKNAPEPSGPGASLHGAKMRALVVAVSVRVAVAVDIDVGDIAAVIDVAAEGQLTLLLLGIAAVAAAVLAVAALTVSAVAATITDSLGARGCSAADPQAVVRPALDAGDAENAGGRLGIAIAAIALVRAIAAVTAIAAAVTAGIVTAIVLAVDPLLDRSFVASLLDDGHSEAIVATIASLGRALSLPITAEGIETDSIRDKLAALGCSDGQGWLFGKAVSGAVIGKHLDEVAATAKARNAA